MFRSGSALFALVLALTGVWSPASGQEGEQAAEDLRKQVQNPVASLISFPLQNNTLLELGPLEKTQNVLNIQPVFPFSLNENWNLISRTILPVISQPEFVDGQGRTDGLGDLSQTVFFSPAKPGKLIWGAGPVAVVPTHSDDRLGTDALSLGPSVVVLKMRHPWVYGILVSSWWDVGGSDDANIFLSQYFVNYNMARGWYLTSSPIITADWDAPSGEKWTVPFGGGGGRVFKIGAQPFNVQAQVFYNVDKPDLVGDWSFRFEFRLMFPK
jgi:hypothetical protein